MSRMRGEIFEASVKDPVEFCSEGVQKTSNISWRSYEWQRIRRLMSRRFSSVLEYEGMSVDMKRNNSFH